MALEPITRQEQIVAGKKLEPITRMERFLKDYGVSNYFGETTVKGDTLTWDGNTEGLVSMDAFAEMIGTLYKISDAVPTLEDCISGVTYTVADDGEQENLSVGYDEIAEMSSFVGCLCIGDFKALAVPENNFQIEVEGVTAIFPEAGLYTNTGGDALLASLTIPGYNGFETTTIKPLDEKYLPESVKGGGGGGATKWEDLGTAGYREDTVLAVNGLEVDEDMGMALVATPFNLVPGKEYQVTFKTNSGAREGTYKCTAEALYMDGVEMGVAIGNTSTSGGTIESEAPFGILAASEAFRSQIGGYGFILPLDGGTRILYCTIDGPVEIVNPIPERYLPEKLQNFGTVFFYAGPEEEVDETGCYLYNSADTTKAENRVTKEELLAVIHSGRAMCLRSTGSSGDLFYFVNISFAQNRLGGCMSATFWIGDLEIVCFTAEHP